MSMQDKFISSLVLAGVGDALGYNNGTWEFDYKGESIHKQFHSMGGLANISIAGMSVSDDQVMHLATAKALVTDKEKLTDLYVELSKCYVESFKDMAGRAPGPTTSIAIRQLENGLPYFQIPYSKGGGGCGGSMRSMCIGLRFHGPENRDKLTAVSIESGRMTHNHPTGFLGAFVSALFTAYAIEGIEPVEWGRKLLHEALPQAYQYLKENGRDWEKYQSDLLYFENAWKEYLELRKILDPEAKEAVFPKKYDVKARDKFYTSISFAGWGGASGHDSVIIAYDALLGSGNDFNELTLRGILHGGDNDSTGVIACSWWGAIHTLKDVPKNIYNELEYRAEAEKYATALYHLRHPST